MNSKVINYGSYYEADTIYFQTTKTIERLPAAITVKPNSNTNDNNLKLKK